MQDVSSLLQSIAGRLEEDTFHSPLLAAEIEFYLTSDGADISSILPAISDACGCVIEKEKGTGQYEIQLSPTTSPVQLADAILSVRNIITDTAKRHNIAASFLSKPYANEPGSSIHIHVNLLDKQGNNVFQKQEGNDPALLLYAIGGLCVALQESMVFFAPTNASYERFVPNSNAPTTVSWGGNNRTTALRIPLSPSESRRIEHRVPGAESNPHVVIAAILAGVHYGITQKIAAPVKIYGDAAHPQYGLPTLVKTRDEAVEAYEEGKVLRHYMGCLYDIL